MKIHPLGSRVLVVAKRAERRTSGGLYIPEQTADMQDRMEEFGTIEEIGPLAWADIGGPEAWGCKVGDRVMFHRQGGKPYEDPETKVSYRVMNDEDILCRVEE